MGNKKFAYMRCPQCNKLNRLDLALDKSGCYICNVCKNQLLLVSNESRMRTYAFVVACMVGLGGVSGYKYFEDKVTHEAVSQSQLNTAWTISEVEHFNKQCRAKIAQRNVNWSSVKIDKKCSCLLNVAQSMNVSALNNTNRDLYERSAEQCVQE